LTESSSVQQNNSAIQAIFSADRENSLNARENKLIGRENFSTNQALNFGSQAIL